MKSSGPPDYEAVVGLEVHCQLSTASKIFCGCATGFGAPPNSQTCPVCLGLPGSLPVLNREVVRLAIRTALATHCTVQTESIFARKNYFYPDLPKGYQISQFEAPLATDGWLEVDVTDQPSTRIPIVRIHMEEDAGKSRHDREAGCSLVDLNRTGIPLIEIVSGPDMHSPEEAMAYLKGLHAIVVALGVSDGNLERGNFRCDANISVRPRGQQALGTKVELKNLNSFRFVGKAIGYEIERQVRALANGETIRQQTRLWNPNTGRSELMREKEDAHDYRYFPEPDLPPLVVTEAEIRALLESLPELPRARRDRFMTDHGLSRSDADVQTSSMPLAEFFEEVARECAHPKAAANWITSELLGKLNRDGLSLERTRVTPTHLAALIRLIDRKEISGKMGKKVFEEVFETGKAPDVVVAEKGYKQISDKDGIMKLIDSALDGAPEKVAEYRDGKIRLLGFFVGQIMKASQGQANPRMVQQLLRQRLDQD